VERRYFDWAAAAPPETAVSTLLEMEVPFGNPSSKHTEGRRARKALEDARQRCAAVLEVPAERLYFTSCGTESNALVLHSLLVRQKRYSGGAALPALLYSAVEHPSIRENALLLERLGFPVFCAGVEGDGRVSERSLSRIIAKQGKPRLTAIMAVNNETGAVMDMPKLTKFLRNIDGPPIHIHSDLVQAVGKIPLDIQRWDLDSASFSAHKLGGPRGIGLLYLRKPLEPIYTGGGQEGGVRPGTENTRGALALAECLERRAHPAVVAETYALAVERWKLLISALTSMERCRLIPVEREAEDPRFSPFILQAAFHGIPGEVMVRSLDDAGFAVSTGSACSSGAKTRPVLAAMGLDDTLSFEGFRISQGWSTGVEDIEALIEAIGKILREL
jgi:cysteine desulfurase